MASKKTEDMQMNPPIPKEKGAKSATLKRLMGYITGVYRFQFVVVIICIVVAAISQTLGMMLLQSLIDDVITPMIGQDNLNWMPLIKVLCQMGTCYALVVITSYAYNRLMINITQGTMKKIRTDMFNKMQKFPMQYFDTHEKGDIMSCYTNDTDTLRQMISQSIPQILSSTITIVAVFVSMLILSWQMTLIVVAVLVIMVFLIKYIAGNSGRAFLAQQEAIGEVNGYIEEMMEGQKVVKVFNHEEACKEQFDQINEKVCANATRANSFANVLMPVMAQMGNLAYVLVAIVGAALAITGLAPITLGILASFLTFTRSFMQPISQVSQQANSIVMALAGGHRIFELMDAPAEIDEGTITIVRTHEAEDGTITESEERTGTWAWKDVKEDGSVVYTPLRGDVRFNHVDFSYVPEKKILKDMTLFAKPGEKIAFVGSTGAGKTTITNLINRFYDIQEGEITYDGINVKDIKKSDLRRSLGIVLQDTHLFSGTVADNIRYGKLDATQEEIEAAAKLANADYFIRHLPNGYDTVLEGDGASLSQGQRQLISIARAAVANCPVLILDEATSSIDTITETYISKGMDQLMDGRTVFVIAHRLSTIQNSQAIMVLEQGVIIERGDHDKLLEEKGKYYQLYTGAVELS